MLTIEVRPLPANRKVVIRSAFFALAKIGAELHSYNEQDGIITATIGRVKIGTKEFFEQAVEVSVEEREDTSLLKLTTRSNKSGELLRLISTYVVGGAKAIKDDAHVQWFELLKDEEARRKRVEEKRTWNENISGMINKFLPHATDKKATSSPSGQQDSELPTNQQQDTEIGKSAYSLTVLNPETKAIAPVDPTTLQLVIPHSPGMLIKNRYGQIFEIQVDSATCSDRVHYLLICPYCSATNLQGSWFCSRCGKQITVGAVVKELKKGVLEKANSSLRFALLGLLPSLVFFALTIMPYLLTGGIVTAATIVSAFTKSFGSITTSLNQGFIAAVLPTLLFAALPSFLIGRKAISDGQQALQHLNLNFYADKTGRGRATIGQAIGWFDMYVGLGLFVLVLISDLLRSQGP